MKAPRKISIKVQRTRNFFFKSKLFYHLEFFYQKKYHIFKGWIYYLFQWYRKCQIQLCYFERSPSLPFWQKGNIVFVEKRNSILKEWKIILLRENTDNTRKIIQDILKIQERSYASTVFLERQSFQNIWKKKICFLYSVFILYVHDKNKSFLFTTRKKSNYVEKLNIA